MRLTLILPIVAALASYVQAHSASELDARDLVDELSLRVEVIDALADISTRDLIEEVSNRLEARSPLGLVKLSYPRPYFLTSTTPPFSLNNMRLTFVKAIPIVVALASYVQGHVQDHKASSAHHARELVDDLSLRGVSDILRREEVADALTDISTRDLMEELSDRLEARSRFAGWPCRVCGLHYRSILGANACMAKHKRK
ncbi:hypothetical protein DFP72DRAFT_1060365 [Ephemerocybe angulata]|uniref:Uncharacterized protein n=1 Tax=Ephemerocybe angulata TaxID=980116 RepID=A0A8H6MEU3_9AGAR|nr:hypothetical protein DFP72DRAFT_1060365 [Tulosesus angulatus]